MVRFQQISLTQALNRPIISFDYYCLTLSLSQCLLLLLLYGPCCHFIIAIVQHGFIAGSVTLSKGEENGNEYHSTS